MVYYIKNVIMFVGIFCRLYDRVIIIFFLWVLKYVINVKVEEFFYVRIWISFFFCLKYNYDMFNLIDMDIKGILIN